jgi:hypothetical protein
MGPRDTVQGGVPTDYDTGQPLTDRQIARINKLKAAHAALLDVMHECEGTSPDNDDFESWFMQNADLLIGIGVMMAKKGALKSP